LEAAVGEVRPGSSVYFGGAGLVRKPMAAARALAGRGVGGLRLVAFIGGPEVDLLVAAGLVAEVHAAAVGRDALGLAPAFRQARQEGALIAYDYSEGMLVAALEAGGRRLPFLPVAAGLGSSLLESNANLRGFSPPFGESELIAVRALRPDFCFLHAALAEESGRVRIPGDRHADLLAAQASDRVFVTAEQVLPAGSFGAEGGDLHRVWVSGVVECPKGAWPTSCYPDYEVDLTALRKAP
jgi:glutaconate CoA-transferase subunit A